MDSVIRAACPADAHAIAAVHVAAWESSYRGILSDAEFEKRPLSVRQEQWANWLSRPQAKTLVACSEDCSVFGFSSAKILDEPDNGFESYLATLYLRPDIKGRGVGRALLISISVEMLAAGARNMVLRTLRLNAAARGFYERLGARLVLEGSSIEAGTFDDVVYAFDDLASLVAGPASAPCGWPLDIARGGSTGSP